MKKSEMTLAQRLVNPNLDKKMEKVRLSERLFIQSNFTGVWSLFFEKPCSNEKVFMASFNMNTKIVNLYKNPISNSKRFKELTNIISTFTIITDNDYIGKLKP